MCTDRPQNHPRIVHRGPAARGRGDGGAGAEAVTALREAFAVVARVRLEHHAAQLAAGAPADNRIDPQVLLPLRRPELREALRAVTAEQRRPRVCRPLGV
jgi:hypothetical protein